MRWSDSLLLGMAIFISFNVVNHSGLTQQVSCRRAASAAFQESVGRVGNFLAASLGLSLPQALLLVTEADFLAVGPTQHAFTRVAPAVARLAGIETTNVLVNHLVSRKISHWVR